MIQVQMMQTTIRVLATSGVCWAALGLASGLRGLRAADAPATSGTLRGDIYLADTWNRKVRKIDAKTGKISTVAGTGKAGYSGDSGEALKATFGDIYCVSLDPKGAKLYLADLDNRRVRVVDLASGIVGLVAGSGQNGVPNDGAEARSAPLV